jgi:hypothetical protein
MPPIHHSRIFLVLVKLIRTLREPDSDELRGIARRLHRSSYTRLGCL